MAIYVITFLVVLGGLVLAFRSMGGREEGMAAADPALVVGGVSSDLEQVVERLQSLVALTGVRADLSDVAKGQRRRLGSLRLTLEQTGEPENAAVATARRDLMAACDELTWACRLTEALGETEGRSGMEQAVADLYRHAAALVAGVTAETEMVAIAASD